MLFRKKMPRSCSYCSFAAKIDDTSVLCSKRGVVPADKSCRKFEYDPCKRIPPKAKAMDFKKYNDEDFSL